MKKLLLAILALTFTSTAHAASGQWQKVFATGTTVSGTNTSVASRVFNFGSVDRLGYWLNGSKATTPEGLAYRVVLEGSYVDTPASVFATMMTVHQSYAFTTTTIPQATAGTLTVPSTKYGRFVLQGVTGNATGSTVEMWVFTQERN